MMRIHNLRSHNMRSFEIPAVGGIQLAPDTPEHRLFFLNEKEIFLYNNARECVDKIKKLLSLPFNEAQEVRIKARERSVNSGYSYKHRSLQALEAMKELLHA
jgi:spore maturation protein CgeB